MPPPLHPILAKLSRGILSDPRLSLHTTYFARKAQDDDIICRRSDLQTAHNQ
jgi:hypothetical protein